MKNDMHYMLIKVGFYDIFIALFLSIISCVFSKEYIFPSILGLLVAFANLFISGNTTNLLLLQNVSLKFLLHLSYYIRIFVTVIIAVVLFKINKYNVLAYVGGYISNFAAIIIYAVNIKNK